MGNELNLMVAEAVDEDKGQNIARLSQNYLDELKINVGEIVEIMGKKKALAIAKKSWHGDNNLNIIRIDKIVRENSEVNIGDIVNIRKINQLKL